jgi:hypothetical protein
LSSLGAFLRAVWDFLIGDDWRTSLGVVLALAVTAVIAASGVSAWWVMPLATIVLLRWSLLRRARVLSSRTKP